MDDIIEKLEFVSESLGHGLCCQAAAEIKRLRSSLARAAASDEILALRARLKQQAERADVLQTCVSMLDTRLKQKEAVLEAAHEENGHLHRREGGLRDEVTELQRSNSLRGVTINEQGDEITNLRNNLRKVNEELALMRGQRDAHAEAYKKAACEIGMLRGDLANARARNDFPVNSLAHKDEVITGLNFRIRDLTLPIADALTWRKACNEAEQRLDEVTKVLAAAREEIEKLRVEKFVIDNNVQNLRQALQNARGTPACVAACDNCTCGKKVL